MAIVNLSFFLFVAALLAVYFLVPKNWRWTVLLAGSYLFYWINGKWLVLVLGAMSLATFCIGLWIDSVNERGKAAPPGETLSREERKARKARAKTVARRILVLGILADLGTLLVLKYSNFFGDGINQLLAAFGGSGKTIPRLHLLMPLGISFYTLQAISYMTDVYRGKIRADRNPAKFMLFMSYFPQIVQGPIPRHGHLARQLYEGHGFDYDRLCKGAQLVLWGLMKKLILAERLAVPAGALFGDCASHTGLLLLLAGVLYGLQVYTDFSGGMDIVRGVSQMLGIELELNFVQPYFSSSIEDFWRRWHITLGRWMRDYVFYPLSLSKAFTELSRKSRKWLGQFVGKRLPAFLAMFIVYFLVGFWHGPEWKYVAYGVWNGVFIMAGILLEETYGNLRRLCGIDAKSFSWRWFRVLRTFVLVSFGRLFTGAPDLKTALAMFRGTFVHIRDVTFLTDGTLVELGLNTANWLLLLAALALLFWVDGLHERNVAIRETIARQHLVFRWAVYIGAVVALLVFGCYGPEYNAANFIYEQF